VKENKKQKESMERLLNQLEQAITDGNTNLVRMIKACIDRIENLKKAHKKD
jgi:phage shock protein A